MADSQLAQALGDHVGDGYAISSEALAFLEVRVRQTRPRAILELGSGISTVALAACMESLHGEESLPHVFSIEEDAGYLERTQRMLRLTGLTANVRLAHRPLRLQSILGLATCCYDLDGAFLDSFLTAAPDFLLIDGPSGGGDARLATLPLLLPHLRGPCQIFVDDALRDDELRVVSLWERIPGFRVHGVHLVGEGLVEARLSGTA